MKKVIALAVFTLIILGAGCSSSPSVENPVMYPTSSESATSSNQPPTLPSTQIVPTSTVSATSTSKTTSTSLIGPLTNAPTSTTKVYTLVEVNAANTPEKCWTTINGKVYDLTLWEKMHPGKEPAIMKLCGIDGTSLFTNKHGGQEQMEQALAMLQIGMLKK
jgi:cytochrome b involved in lipid metabolism